MSALRIGVVGAGNMGADHIATLHRDIPGAEVTAVADIDPERAAEAATTCGARPTGDALALIASPDVEAVIIASHDATHAPLTLAAMAEGKPVLCEKPLAPTLDECARVVREEGRLGGGLISLGFMRRFDPAYADLKGAVAAREHGDPLVVHCISRGVSAAPGATDELSITGSAIHEFDTVPWLLDAPVTEVSWHAPRSASAATGLHDPQVMLLRTADGVLTTVEVFLNARYGYDIRCEVVGERGTLALGDGARLVSDSGGIRSTGYPRDWRPRFADAYRLQLRAWAEAVAAKRPSPLASADDGLRASAVAQAAITSMKDGGRTVTVSIPEG